MSYVNSFKKISRAKQFGNILLIAVFTWMVGLPLIFTTASAAQMSSVSATASTSVNSASGNMLIRFTSTTTVATGETITLEFSYGNAGGANEYSLASLTVNDVISPDITIITGACGAVTPNQASINGGIANSAGDRTVTLTACGAISTGAKRIFLINDHLTNPATTGSYKIRIDGTQTDTGIAMTAVLPAVTVTAAVDTTLTFTVTGVASGQSVNGTTTSTTTTSTAIGFGVLASGTPVVAAQDLAVTTNAQNGFIVTVRETQNLTSSNGADIDLFQDGSATATPIAWTSPTASLGVENSYGHFGLTSDDADLNSGEFIANKWAGNFFSTTTRTIFSHTGPSDGTTQNVGRARIGYQIQVSSLQEAATDYSNQLIYVCTPTF